MSRWVMQPEPVRGHPQAGMAVWGWTSPDELAWLQATAATMNSVVEVGSLHGRSASALLEGCPGPVWCVDPWNDPGNFCYPSFMRSCGHYPNLNPVQGYSPAVIDDYELPDVDMVFLDGAHDAASVRADIEAWAPKVRRLLCGHDYVKPDGAFPDVPLVVDEMFGDRVTVAPGTAIWCVKMGG